MIQDLMKQLEGTHEDWQLDPSTVFYSEAEEYPDIFNHFRSDENYITIYENNPILGSAYINKNFLIYPNDRYRAFTILKYRFPNMPPGEFYHQGFYISSGVNTGSLGYRIFFPFDGHLLNSNPSTKKFYLNYLKVVKTESRKHIKKNILSRPQTEFLERFGSPIFLIVSYFLRIFSLEKATQIFEKDKFIDKLLKAFNVNEGILDIMKHIELCVLDKKRIKFHQINEKIIDKINIINMYIADGISFNYLRNIPSSISSITDEYPNRSVNPHFPLTTHLKSSYQLNYNEILFGKEYLITHFTGRVHGIEPYYTKLYIEIDGIKYIHDFFISFDLLNDGFNIKNFTRIYNIPSKIKSDLDESVEEIDNQMANLGFKYDSSTNSLLKISKKRLGQGSKKKFSSIFKYTPPSKRSETPLKLNKKRSSLTRSKSPLKQDKKRSSPTEPASKRLKTESINYTLTPRRSSRLRK